MRDALGMSTYQLAKRMSLSPTRVRQLQREEVDGSIRLSSLSRAAEAMHCTLRYALVPKEPLEDIVLRHAYLKAVSTFSVVDADHPSADNPELVPLNRIDELEDLTLHLVDHRDLWS